jgi:hypothetical protein
MARNIGRTRSPANVPLQRSRPLVDVNRRSLKHVPSRTIKGAIAVSKWSEASEYAGHPPTQGPR